jgi:FkbM family methyltransferase
MDSTTFLKLRANLRRHARLRQAVHDAAELPLVGPVLRFRQQRPAEERRRAVAPHQRGLDAARPVGWKYFESEGEADTTEAPGRIKRGMHVWDIGSHAGFYTMMMAGLAGPSGRVLAVEADPDNARRCEDALVRNGLAGFCSVLSCAVCDEAGEVRFRRSTAGRMSGKLVDLPRSRFGGSEEILNIRASTIDRTAGTRAP